MGGDIRVESEVGHGSKFTFRVWLKATDEPEEIRHQEAALRGQRVLAVDDNSTNLHILGLMLERMHMRQESADNGAEALEMANQAAASGDPYRFILLDARMPDTDGFMVAEALRGDARHAGTTLLMLTSAGQRGDAARCKELGLNAYLTKPISLTELRDALENGQDAPSGEQPLNSRPSLGETRPSYKILLAEDNLVNQKLAVKLLEKQGHQVAVADNGILAVEAWREGGFDLILMDMMMPEMDGLEATRRIREIENSRAENQTRVPIIAMTANAMTGDRERCIEAGMDGYVSKPVKPEILYEEIDRILPEAAKSIAPHPAKVVESAQRNSMQLEKRPVYDRADALSRIADDEELLSTLLGMFVADAPNHVDEINTALSAQDWPRLLRASHTMKGLFATFSARRGEHVAQALELNAKSCNIDVCREIAAHMHDELQLFLNAIQADLQ